VYEKQSQLHTIQNQSNCLIFCPINCISRHMRWKSLFSLQPMTAWLKFWLKLIKHHDIKGIITDGEFVGENVKHQMIVIIAPMFVIGNLLQPWLDAPTVWRVVRINYEALGKSFTNGFINIPCAYQTRKNCKLNVWNGAWTETQIFDLVVFLFYHKRNCITMTGQFVNILFNFSVCYNVYFGY
jgi:hypothetical protein